MGLDVYAHSIHEVELSKELEMHGLDSNLRHCGINVWKSVYKSCTGVAVSSWDEVSSEDVLLFYENAKCVVQETSDNFIIESSTKIHNATKYDVIKMCKYFEICSKYGASLVFM